MVRIRTSKSFRRDFKKADREIQKATGEMIKEIQSNGINSTMKPHPLHGKKKGYWTLRVPSVNNDMRLIYKRLKEGLCFYALGKHDKVYREN